MTIFIFMCVLTRCRGVHLVLRDSNALSPIMVKQLILAMPRLLRKKRELKCQFCKKEFEKQQGLSVHIKCKHPLEGISKKKCIEKRRILCQSVNESIYGRGVNLFSQKQLIKQQKMKKRMSILCRLLQSFLLCHVKTILFCP